MLPVSFDSGRVYAYAGTPLAGVIFEQYYSETQVVNFKSPISGGEYL
jgi:hypothetical protein